MQDLKQHIDSTRLPNHIAITMDGNGRWATGQGKQRITGHQNGIRPVDECTEACAELGGKNLTLYAFSKQNWNRPEEEVNALMNLLVETIQKETEKLQKNNIRLNAIGDLENLPSATYDSLHSAIEETKNNDRMTLTLALSYGSRHEILEASKKLAKKLSSGIEPVIFYCGNRHMLNFILRKYCGRISAEMTCIEPSLIFKKEKDASV